MHHADAAMLAAPKLLVVNHMCTVRHLPQGWMPSGWQMHFDSAIRCGG